MRAMFAGMIMATFAGTAFAQTDPGAQDRAKETYTRCLVRAAQSSDDRKSSPAVIAKAILQTCRPDFDRVVDSFTRGVTPQVKAKVRAKAMTDASYVGNAVTIVRNMRQQRARSGTQSR